MPAGIIPRTDQKTTCDPSQHLGILKHHTLKGIHDKANMFFITTNHEDRTLVK